MRNLSQSVFKVLPGGHAAPFAVTRESCSGCRFGSRFVPCFGAVSGGSGPVCEPTQRGSKRGEGDRSHDGRDWLLPAGTCTMGTLITVHVINRIAYSNATLGDIPAKQLHLACAVPPLMPRSGSEPNQSLEGTFARLPSIRWQDAPK